MPSLPIRQLPIHAFLGEVEGIKSIALAAVFSSGGSRNVWMDAYGQVSAIGGYARLTPSPILTADGGPTLATALYHYVRDAGSSGALRQELAIFDNATDHYELRKSIDGGGIWTLVEELVDATHNPCGAVTDFAALGNLLVLTNGAMQVRFWDGTTLVTSFQERLAAPTTVVNGVGKLEGNYQVRIVPMVNDRRKLGSPLSAVLVAEKNKVDVAWVADVDPQVTAYEVYSTTGTGRVLYRAGTTAGTTFTLDQDDLDLIQNRPLQEHGDPPPETRYCEIHKGRVFYGGLFPDAPRTWFASDPGLVDSVYTDTARFDATDAESFSDATVGATGNFHEMFVIWLERSIWTISGSLTQSGPVIDARLDRSDARTGTVTHRAVARVPAGAKFTDERGNVQATKTVMLAYLTPLKDIRLFDGSDDTIISTPMQATLGRLTYAARGTAYVVEDIRRTEITWVFPTGEDTDRANTAVTWNYRTGIWYHRPLWDSIGCVVAGEASNAAVTLIAANNDRTLGALVYRLWEGHLADGVEYRAQWMSKTLYFLGMSGAATETGADGAELITHQKRVRWMDVLFKAFGGTRLLVEWLKAEADDDAEADGSVELGPGSSALETSDDSPILTADDSPIVCIKPKTIVRARIADSDGRYFHGRGIRLRISAVATNT